MKGKGKGMITVTLETTAKGVARLYEILSDEIEQANRYKDSLKKKEKELNEEYKHCQCDLEKEKLLKEIEKLEETIQYWGSKIAETHNLLYQLK